MILKISDGDKGWVWFDDVVSPHFLSSMTKVMDEDEARAITYDSQQVTNLISKKCFIQQDDVDVGLIKFRSNNREYIIAFTGIIYICDNNGDTIEKIDLNKGK
jgi:hypothetical protein